MLNPGNYLVVYFGWWIWRCDLGLIKKIRCGGTGKENQAYTKEVPFPDHSLFISAYYAPLTEPETCVRAIVVADMSCHAALVITYSSV